MWRLRRLVALIALVIPGSLAYAADPGAPTALPDPGAPTAWACSTKTLDTATDCLLEADTARGGDTASAARDNVRQAQAHATKLCRKASTVSGEGRPDEELFATCQREFAAAAETSCSLDGESTLLDAQGRFAVDARACYAALDGVLRRTRMHAVMGVRCCRCLEKSCGVPRATCTADIDDGALADASVECTQKKRECARACSLVTPPAETSAPAPVPAPSRPSNRARFEWL